MAQHDLAVCHAEGGRCWGNFRRGVGDNRARYGVLTELLAGPDERPQKRQGRLRLPDGDVGAHGHVARGERAGLVEDDGADGAGALDRRAVLDEHAVLRRYAGADHDGGGRREAECAGARHDNDGGRDAQAREEGRRALGVRPRADGDARVGRERVPQNECEERQQEDRGHEHSAHAVRVLLDGRLLELRVFNGVDDLGELRVAADRGHAQAQVARPVDGARDRARPRALVHAARLAREQRLVHLRLAVRHGSVRGDRRAGKHLHGVPQLQQLHGYGAGVAIATLTAYCALRRGERDQAAQRGARLRLGAVLEKLPHRHERHEHHRGIEHDSGRRSARCHHRRADLNERERVRAERRDRNERVHRPRAARAPRLPRRRVEYPPDTHQRVRCH